MQSMHAKIGDTHAPLSVCVDGSLYLLTTMYICALLLMEPQAAAAVAIHTHVDSLAHGRIRE